MNKNLFKQKNRRIAVANTRNTEGALAYSQTAENELASYVATSCLNDKFYSSDKDQLDAILALAKQCGTEFVAACAVYGRQVARMKDTPALLCAVLTTRGAEGLDLLEKVFPVVTNNVDMVRRFFRIVRSGVVGRSNLGYRPRNILRKRLLSWTPHQLFMQSIGNDPSLATIIKLTHANPGTPERDALFKYLLGKEYNYDALPEIVQAFEDFKLCLKNDENTIVPKLPFQMLTSLPLKAAHWEKIALDMSWNTLRMNLNTVLRHGVNDANIIAKLANKLRDPDEVRRNNVFPYQLLTTYLNTTDIPARLRNALQDAAEIATENTPEFGDGSVAIALDVSGSMRNALTGDRGSVTTKTRCVDVAAMFATCVLRKNENSIVLPFDDKIYTPDINPRDSIMTNAAKLAGIGGGGTFCQLPLAKLNEMNWKGNLVVYFSDNEALSAYSGTGISATRNWLGYHRGLSNGTQILTQDHTLIAGEWDKFKRRNPKAKLVLIDVAPYETTQIPNSKDVLNIAGWSDTVWKRIADFARGEELDFAKVVRDHFSAVSVGKNLPAGLDAPDLD